MATFFDKFRKYSKDYIRERPTKTTGEYGNKVTTSSDQIPIKGIITRKSVQSEAIVSGKSEIGYWKSMDVFFVGPEVDIRSGDILIDGDSRYECPHIEKQDDFTQKNSHVIVYLKKIE